MSLLFSFDFRLSSRGKQELSNIMLSSQVNEVKVNYKISGIMRGRGVKEREGKGRKEKRRVEKKREKKRREGKEREGSLIIMCGKNQIQVG